MSLRKKLAALAIVGAVVLTVVAFQDESIDGGTKDVPSFGLDVTNKTGSTKSSAKKSIKTLNLKKEQVVLLSSEVNDQTINEAISALKKASDDFDEVFLVIDSPGGSVFAGAKLISFIEGTDSTIYTVCDGMCASMGAQIHQAGSKRLMTDRSILMFHPASIGGIGGQLHEIESVLELLTVYVDKLDKQVASRSGIEFRKFKEMTMRNLWIDSEDATNLKLSDGIVFLNITNEDFSKSNTKAFGTEDRSKTKKSSLIETIKNLE